MIRESVEHEWHALSVDEVLQRLGSSSEGLSASEAEKRLAEFGPNTIAKTRRVSAFVSFMQQFRSPLIYILLAASLISFALGEVTDGEVILVIVLFNAVIGFAQEYKAEKALEALKRMAAATANVVRGAEEIEVPAEQVVPGDVIAIEAGDRIPADARLIEEARLSVDESALTGESVPAGKSTQTTFEESSLADRSDMLYAGTSVKVGRGMAVVVATGGNTETGRIAKEVQESPVIETPIQRKLAEVGRWLGIIGLVVALVLVLVGLLRGFPVYTLFFTAVAAAVAFIPESLPAVVTIVLAIGVQRMAKRHAIIRKLPAVESLGSATVICTDKTGTLTKNEMTVEACYVSGQRFEISGGGYDPAGEYSFENRAIDPADRPDLTLALTAAVLCNDAHMVELESGWSISGDPTEGALVVAARKAGIRKIVLDESHPRRDEIPFESETKYMATLNMFEDRPTIFVKGAPEIVISMCSLVRLSGQSTPLSQEHLDGIRSANEFMAGKSHRVLAVAYKEAPSDRSTIDRDDIGHGLVFLGLFGMMDPARDEAFQAVEDAKRAGIRVIMITGDNPATAKAIAAKLGILDGNRVVSGQELELMSDGELSDQIGGISVFARVEPRHKHRIVEMLKSKNELVAMTGDGVNDAPALKRADIGIAMGRGGTDVARESADVVLADDNFATIIAAVEEGRTIFANLRKIVQYLLGTNSGEILTFLTAIVVGLPLPLLPVQILWVNLVTDGFATVPLAVEPEEGDVMLERPRDPGEPVITRRSIWRIAMVAILMAAGTLALFTYVLHTSGLAHARTTAFAALAIFQLFNTFNARSSVHSIFKVGFLTNRYVLLGVGASFLLQIAVTHVPFLQSAFKTTALSMREWVLILLVSSSVLIVEEIRKLLAPRLFESDAQVGK
ncbi:MAG TPA: HAD-IC family P-type ATPase [Armatimonadota bacterium]